MALTLALLRLSHPGSTVRERGAAASVLLDRVRAVAGGRVAGSAGRGFSVPPDCRDEVVARVVARLVQLTSTSSPVLFRPIASRSELAVLLDVPPDACVDRYPTELATADRLLGATVRTMVARAAIDDAAESDGSRARRLGLVVVPRDADEANVPAVAVTLCRPEAYAARATLRGALATLAGRGSTRVLREPSAAVAELLALGEGDVTIETLVCRRLEAQDPALAAELEEHARRVHRVALAWPPRSRAMARALTILAAAAEARDTGLVDEAVENLAPFGGPPLEELREAAEELRRVVRRATGSKAGVAARNAIHQAQSRLRSELRDALAEEDSAPRPRKKASGE